MELENLAKIIVEYCTKNNVKKVYICGNGGAGKTTFSKAIAKIAETKGTVNRISLDDFMADEQLKAKAISKWTENGEEFEYRCTSSTPESYFLRNVYELLYNIDNGLDCFYFPRRYKEKNNIRRLYADNVLTIIEGIGTVFLERDIKNSLSIYLVCSKEEEILRREKRADARGYGAVELYDEKRSSQFRVFVEPLATCFDMIVESGKDYNLTVIKNEKIKI